MEVNDGDVGVGRGKEESDTGLVRVVMRSLLGGSSGLVVAKESILGAAGHEVLVRA